LIVACKYKGPVRDAIKSVKYKWQFDVASVLVNLLVFNIWRFSLNKDLVMVPIPLYKNREKWRGFNQAAKLTQLLSEKFNHKYVFLMERVKNTKTQVGLSRKQRKSNIKGAFIVSSDFKIRGKEFLLVDDVYTSGATMAEACRVLKKAGAKEVWGMVVALG
jgi:competence protein ComFC